MIGKGQQLARSYDINLKVAQVLQRRLKVAQEHFTARVRTAWEKEAAASLAQPRLPTDLWAQAWRYGVDTMQRSVLFWDTLRQRGNNFLEHERAGKPPVLHFEYEMVMDGRQFVRPVNYALVRILPPEGVAVDPKRRPYVVIDPRAGHGPGIGGMKDDSQVGVAIREGHPVYFVIFYPDPEPGQTLPDVTEAERQFVHKVRELHPDSPRPAIVGNCQGGWAAMMLAAADPEDTGPIVINGAPMSYWGGAWREGEGDNPMRYSGGLLGGTWLSSLTADLGNGIFDGAWLVQNFENLNPANTLVDKLYHVYANVDTEPPRFLEFERWFGGYFMLNREEIEWITRNLFVGNDLWSGTVKSASGKVFDLREIKSPIVLFASLGDNITPPQQAFNWVADIYGSTDEIKARGQVIVGLVHGSIGHLGIFVSGKVARKEHAQIVSVLKSIESLPPGLYGMQIIESRGEDGAVTYDVQFIEHRLEDLAGRMNRFKRIDEKPFEAVEAVSEFNQRAYELFVQPLVQAGANEFTAKLSRQLHPLRVQQWAWSDVNPWLWWLGPAAAAVKAQREPVAADAAPRRAEALAAELASASLDWYREVRDALSEASFFQIYGNMFSIYLADKRKSEAQTKHPSAETDPRELPFVKSALSAIGDGGFAEALARAGVLLQRRGVPLPLSRVELRREVAEEYAELLPDVTMEQWRRIRGEQEIIVRYEPDRALEMLPKLLANRADRERFLAVVAKLMSDERIIALQPTEEQIEMLARIRSVLGLGGSPKLAAVG